jgi:hypothetical protein
MEAARAEAPAKSLTKADFAKKSEYPPARPHGVCGIELQYFA